MAYARYCQEAPIRMVKGRKLCGKRSRVHETIDEGDSVSVIMQPGLPHCGTFFGAFAFVKDDGSVVTWGNLLHGGDSCDVNDALVNIMWDV